MHPETDQSQLFSIISSLLARSERALDMLAGKSQEDDR